jgi:SNF2 family DNA or RNA helicase
LITAYHAKYFAHELSIQHANLGVDRLSQSLFDASVDLNPHQIEAALFALNNPLNKGVVLADEVGLGKTIEAGLVLCQYWAERKRKLLIICPAALRRQWAQELQDKFNLPSHVLDARNWSQLQKEGIYNPLNNKRIVIMSYHYAARIEDKLVAEPWNLVVIDEAHKLRNAHRDSNKMGQALKRALNGRQKLLLTATPLQNSLIELYGMSTLIDEHLFGDDRAFRKQYMSGTGDIAELKERLGTFLKRTLRKQVLEYVKYTERKTITAPFEPTALEQELYNEVSAFLDPEQESYALPKAQRHLTGLILRKLLASSTHAVIFTLETIKLRLEKLRDLNEHMDLISRLMEDDELDAELMDQDADFISDYEEHDACVEEENTEISYAKLSAEIAQIEKLIAKAKTISVDSKARALLNAMDKGFAQMRAMNAPEKVIIFTESRRTQEYVANFLAANGYADKLVTFSGTNNSPETTKIYHQWKAEHEGSDRITGSPQVDRRTALIDHFKNHAQIMIATEAAAEGVNLQFCSLLINYDLPWNPQRVEQRIGRCHRYGQKFDVVVINFLNKSNYADARVLELLTEKFNLFDGVFGASDDVLGSIESGVDFEKRIQEIYETCRTQEAIARAFDELQKQLEQDINQRLKETQKLLIDNFDEDIHDLLRIKLDQAEQRLDKLSRWFWLLTQYILANKAEFNHSVHSFDIPYTIAEAPPGRYQLIRANGEKAAIEQHSHTYRLSHPLGEYVVEQGRTLATPVEELIFDYTSHIGKVAMAEHLQGQSGWMALNLLRIESFQVEEHLVFTGLTDKGDIVDGETCKKLFNVGGHTGSTASHQPEHLGATIQRQLDAKMAEAMDTNNRFFHEEREKLEKWADDKILAAEQALQDTKAKIKALKRDTRQALSLEDQQALQKELQDCEKLQRRQRQQIFDVEDEIIERRDALIGELQKRLKQVTKTDLLFMVRWSVI